MTDCVFWETLNIFWRIFKSLLPVQWKLKVSRVQNIIEWAKKKKHRHIKIKIYSLPQKNVMQIKAGWINYHFWWTEKKSILCVQLLLLFIIDIYFRPCNMKSIQFVIYEILVIHTIECVFFLIDTLKAVVLSSKLCCMSRWVDSGHFHRNRRLHQERDHIHLS